MEINIKKEEKAYHFTATNQQVSVQMCGSEKLVENPVGFRPTELILAGLGGCMSIDVLSILEKSKQQVSKFDVKVNATRREEVPGLFKDIVITIIVDGEVKQSKLEQAIRLSEDKFCTVYKIVEKTANIKTVYILNGVAAV
jgi:putative redox protein